MCSTDPDVVSVRVITAGILVGFAKEAVFNMCLKLG